MWEIEAQHKISNLCLNCSFGCCDVSPGLYSNLLSEWQTQQMLTLSNAKFLSPPHSPPFFPAFFFSLVVLLWRWDEARPPDCAVDDTNSPASCGPHQASPVLTSILVYEQWRISLSCRRTHREPDSGLGRSVGGAVNNYNSWLGVRVDLHVNVKGTLIRSIKNSRLKKGQIQVT